VSFEKNKAVQMYAGAAVITAMPDVVPPTRQLLAFIYAVIHRAIFRALLGLNLGASPVHPALLQQKLMCLEGLHSHYCTGSARARATLSMPKAKFDQTKRRVHGSTQSVIACSSN
jgi:hypothetical protein